MTIPDLATLVPRWKFYLAIAGAILIALTGIYIYADNRGYNRADSKWQQAVANSKPVEVKRDTITIYVPSKPTSGTSHAVPVEMTPKYLAAVDSIKKLNVTVEELLEPQSATFENETLGKLDVNYFPAWKQFEYAHNPPPAKIERVTVWMEKPVLVPRSDYETVGYVAIGGGLGVAAATSDPKIRTAGLVVAAIGLAYEYLK